MRFLFILITTISLHAAKEIDNNLHRRWRHSPLDYHRFSSSLLSASNPNILVSNLVAIDLPVQSESNVPFHFVPAPISLKLGSPPTTTVSFKEMLSRAQDKCSQFVPINTDGHEFCTSVVMAKTIFMSSDPVRNHPVHLQPWELNTPRHVVLGAVTRAIKSVGVAVTSDALTPEAVNRLRNVVIRHPEYQAQRKQSKRTRYLDPLCASVVGSDSEEEEKQKHSICQAWDDEFIELVSDKRVLSEVERILGTDCIVDSTTISVQWPGEAAFGPHVDRPFVIDANVDGHWKYSTTLTNKGALNNKEGMSLPPMEYPLSIQILWLFDHFSTSNGAFYLIDTQHGYHGDVNGGGINGGTFRPSSHDDLLFKYPRGQYPNQNDAQMVTSSEGSIIFAHGGLLHGAAPNLHSRPRIAFLVQYVPKFVRPGKSYPMSMLSNKLASMKDPTARARLLELFDVSDSPSFSPPPPQPSPPPPSPPSSPSSPSSHQHHPPAAKYYVRQTEEQQQRHSPPKFPVIAFGVGMSTASLNGPSLRNLIKNAMLAGIRHLDLAEMYGNHLELGILFKELWRNKEQEQEIENHRPHRRNNNLPSREEMFLTSKVWTTNMHPDIVHFALLHTLRELEVDYLDLWMIHWPIPMVHTTIENPSKGLSWPEDEHGRTVFASGYSICDTWHAMEKSVELGFVKYLGVSNFSPAMLHTLLSCARNVLPIVNQVEAHPYLPQTKLLKFCRENNVIMQAYSPLGNGNEGLLSEPSLMQAARAKNVTAAQVAFRWSLQRGVPIVSSTRRVQRIPELLHSNHGFLLEEEEMASIDQVSIRSRFVVPDQFRFIFS